METYIASSEVSLVDALSFSSPKIASYVTGRRQVQLNPSGGDVYGPSGVGTNVIRFSLSTSGPFLDLSTLCIIGTLTNRDAVKDLTILGPNFGACITSMRMMIGGVVVDEVQYSNRTESMLSLLQSEGKQIQAYSEGLGAGSRDALGNLSSTPIPKTASRRCIYKPTVLGCLQQQNYLPVALTSGGACTLECTLVSDAAACCDTSSTTNSTDWVLSGLAVLVDCIQVDSAFLSSLGAHLSNNGSLQLAWKSYSTSFYSILAANAQLAHSRANSRLNAVFFTFLDGGRGATASKECNRFYMSPSADLKSHVMCGESRYPDSQNNHGLAMHYHRLLHAIGSVNNVAHHTAIENKAYALNKFIGVQDFEALPSAADHSGINTYNSQLSLMFEGLGAPGSLPLSCYITSYFDVMMEVTANGITISN